MNSRLICMLIVIFGTSAMSENQDDAINPLLYLVWKLSDAVNEFALNLHSVLSKNINVNLVFSPLSVTNTLAMLHFGAKGRTAKELDRVLAYEKVNLTKTSASKAYKYLLTNALITYKPRYYYFELANVIFLNKKLEINPVYWRKAEDHFKSPIKLINFSDKNEQAMSEVNQWVKEKTRNRIKRIVNNLDPTVDIVIANTVFFKGLWSFQFKSENTRDQVFYNSGLKRKFVPMMKQENIFFYGSDDEMSLLELPFKGNNVSMIFILPHKMDGLLELERHINLESMLSNLETTSLHRVLVTIPKFKVAFSAELVPALRSMGLTQLFQPSQINLSGMVQNSERIAIGEVKHRAVIEIDEFGVEASAATATVSIKSGLATDRVEAEFFVNHPFMFAVLDKRNGILLFVGRIWKL